MKTFRKFKLRVSLLAIFAASAAVCAQDAQGYLTDLNQLNADSAQVSVDRTAMANDLADTAALRTDVAAFFAARRSVSTLETKTVAERVALMVSIRYKELAFVKPVAARGPTKLQFDANRYLFDYSDWSSQDTRVQQDLSAITSAVLANDATARKTALKAYFADRHARYQALLDIETDIRALRRDVKFKAAGKPAKQAGATLPPCVTTFLNDRATWSNQESALDADRTALSTALSANGDVAAAVTTLLTDRHAHFVQGEQLAADLRAMEVFTKSASVTFASPASNENAPDDDPEVEQTSSTAGE